MTEAELLLAQVWKDVLGAQDVRPDDDFYSLGGDSLLALKVVTEAEARGLPLTLVQLFRNPTLRGACAGLSPAGASSAAEQPLGDLPQEWNLLGPGDRENLPADAESAVPATRLQLGMIYESLVSRGTVYVDSIARDIQLPLDTALLEQALETMAQRHPGLRTRFDLTGFDVPVAVVSRAAVLRLSPSPTDLGQPFDPENGPLIRVHAAGLPDRDSAFRLSYAFHHAIMDGWSESVFVSELVRLYAGLLRGEKVSLPRPARYEEYVRLEREAVADPRARDFFVTRYDGTAAARHSAEAVHDKRSMPVPHAIAQRWEELARQWGVPMKSLAVAVHCAAVAEVWQVPAPVVGLSVNGRPETEGGDLTIGLFLNHLPLRLELAGLSWQEAARGALAAEHELLPHRRFPYAQIREAVGGDPFEVALSYVHFHLRDDLLASGLVGVEEDMYDHTSLPVRVELINDPRGLGLGFDVTADTARYGEGFAQRLGEALLRAAERLATQPDSPALPLATAAID
ncbi:condensation domain-containing protein [Streptomyces sp. NPDC014622]|uniref:condensation domain-containing protein n=1 Tax=Streptomyces sp. NPDC014622 TaxID=3364874 RepID=UPI00370298C4